MCVKKIVVNLIYPVQGIQFIIYKSFECVSFPTSRLLKTRARAKKYNLKIFFCFKFAEINIGIRYCGRKRE